MGKWFHLRWRFLAGLAGLLLADCARAANLAFESARDVFAANSGPWAVDAHSATIVQTTSGLLLVAWKGGARDRLPGVDVWLSRFADGEWSAPVRIADGEETGKDFTIASPVLFQPEGGPLILFYDVGPHQREGVDRFGRNLWGVLKTSADDGRTWSALRALGEDARLPGGKLNGPTKNPPIQLPDGSILVASSNEYGLLDSNDVDRLAWHFEKSIDLGRTWSVAYICPPEPALRPIQPGFLRLGEGILRAVGGHQAGNETPTATSQNNGDEWSGVSGLPSLPAAGALFPVTLSDGTHLCVVNPLDSERRRLRVMASRDGERWQVRLNLDPESGRRAHYPQGVQSADGQLHLVFTQDEGVALNPVIRHVVLKTELPAAPAALQAMVVSPYQINLQWAVAKPSPVPVRVERRRDLDGAWAEVGGAGTTAPSFQDVTVLPATTYRYRIRAFNQHGTSPWSMQVEAATPPAGAIHGLIEIAASADRPNEAPLNVDLTAEGTLDWFQCYEKKSSVRKAGVKPMIEPWILSDFGKGNVSGGRPAAIYSATRTSWTDGEPVASASNELCRWNGGFWHRGHYGIGYGFSVVADTMERIVRIHCGRWGMKGFLNAWLSDGSVAPVEYLTPDVANMKIADTTFTIRYRAATPGQKLHFVWRHLGEPWDSDANLWVAAVTLAEAERR